MRVEKALLPIAAIVILLTPISGALALFSGLVLALPLVRPLSSGVLTPRLLQLSVIGLGAGMNFKTVIETGTRGIGYTFAGLASTLGVAWLLRRVLKVGKEEAALIAVGTAICGGSAIAAVGPAIGAGPASMSVALGTVFILNSVALVVFPAVGHALQLTQEQFGLWSALAIHDTSSVVGATVAFGEEAARIGTTVKLSRTLWIIPLTFLSARLFRKDASRGEAASVKKPWFILGFLAMAAAVTWIPGSETAGKTVEWLSRRSLVLTLFLIGGGLTRERLKQVGPRPFFFGLILWVVVSILSLGGVLFK